MKHSRRASGPAFRVEVALAVMREIKTSVEIAQDCELRSTHVLQREKWLMSAFR